MYFLNYLLLISTQSVSFVNCWTKLSSTASFGRNIYWTDLTEIVTNADLGFLLFRFFRRLKMAAVSTRFVDRVDFPKLVHIITIILH